MATEKKAAGEKAAGEKAPKEKAPKGKRSRLVPAVVICLGLLGGGYFMGPGKSGAATPDGGDQSSTTTTTIPGPVIVLDPITLNVQGGHYLKVSLALQMSAEYGETAGEAKDDNPTVRHAATLDAAIDVFGGSSYEQLVTPAGREVAKTKLVQKVVAKYGGGLEDIYFTEFVLQ